MTTHTFTTAMFYVLFIAIMVIYVNVCAYLIYSKSMGWYGTTMRFLMLGLLLAIEVTILTTSVENIIIFAIVMLLISALFSAFSGNRNELSETKVPHLIPRFPVITEGVVILSVFSTTSVLTLI